tara:strand:- start:247 stop:522 length:276 start_codon:yes stop_codon:yes gene_type:complete
LKVYKWGEFEQIQFERTIELYNQNIDSLSNEIMNSRLESEYRKDALERGIELHKLLTMVVKSLLNLHLELLPLESKEIIGEMVKSFEGEEE